MVVDLDPGGADGDAGGADLLARGRPAPGSRPRSRGPGRARRSPAGRRRAAATAEPSIRVAPMYSPCAVAGSISLVMRVEVPVGADLDLHLLVGERLVRVDGEEDLRPARRQQRLLDRDRVHRVAVDHQDAVRHVLAGRPHGVGVVPDLGLVVVHQRERDAVAALEVRLALLDRVGGVPDDHDDLAQVDRGEVAQGDVQDGRVAVHRHQRLRQRVGVGAETASGTGGQHHADHRCVPSWSIPSRRADGARRPGYRGVPSHAARSP